jgi:hypothetical protein
MGEYGAVWAVINTAIKLGSFKKNVGNLLSNLATISVSRSLLHGVN